MTAPVWMAAPPEVHSTLLSSGPGPGPLLASAAGWMSLSTEYAAGADELSALLGSVQAGAWEGPSADRYVAAHLPYLGWLLHSSAKSAALATQQETAAAAYTAALAAMPTLPELALNHVTHGALVATNFFGLNTIPIAVNEADYARMWTQAATTMSLYQTVSGAAVAATPPATPAPPIMKTDAASDPNDFFGLGDLWQQLQHFEGADSFWQLLWPGNPFTSYPPGTDLGDALGHIWTSFIQGLFLYDPQTLAFAHNPAQLIAVLLLAGVQLITHRIFDLLQLLYNFPQLLLAVVPLISANLGAVGGFAGLAGLAGATPPPVVAAEVVPAAPVPAAAPAPAVALAPVLASTPGPAPVAPAAPAASPAPPPPPPSPPPAVTGVEAAACPYVVGGPGIGSGAGMSASDKAKKTASTPESAAAAAAAAAARHAARARRRRRTGMRGHGDEYMDMNIEVEPDWGTAASDRGAGRLGFAGTAGNADATAAGLAALGGSCGRGPTMPMMPASWEPKAVPKRPTYDS